MEDRGFQAGWFSPATSTPENNFSPFSDRFDNFFTSLDLPHQDNGFMSYPTLESSFSRLRLLSDYQPQPPSLGVSPAGFNGVAGMHGGTSMDQYYSPDFARDRGVGNVGVQRSSSSVLFQNGGQDFDFLGTHLNSMVGPGNYCDPSSSSGSSVAGNRGSSRWLNTEVEDGNHLGFHDYHHLFLDSKKPLPRRTDSLLQNPRFPYQDVNSFPYFQAPVGDSRFKNSNSRGRLSNTHLYGWQEQFESLELMDFRGKFVAFAKDQHGNSILQEKLEKNRNAEEISIVLSEVFGDVPELMMNQFGSHFIQKLFDVCSEEQRTTIIIAATRNYTKFLSICLNNNGARIMKKLLGNLSTPQQISLVTSALTPGVSRLCIDPNGQHLVQFCIQNFSHEYNKHLFREIQKNCFEIAIDKNGCHVLQCCVDFAQGESKEQLMTEIIRNSLQLAEDPYGNYVVQHLLGKKIPHKTNELLRHLKGHFVYLSCNKHGSFVVEKILDDYGEEHARKIIKEFLATPNPNSLLCDPTGNYVMQKALSVSKCQGYLYLELCRFIQANAASLKSNLYGRKVLAFLEKDESSMYRHA